MAVFEYPATLVKAVDGDTLDFVLDLGFNITHKIRVRLFGIDTPETFRPRNEEERKHGLGAKMLVTTFVGRKGMLVTHKGKKGKYGRYLADFVMSADNPQGCISIIDLLREQGFEKKDNYGETDV